MWFSNGAITDTFDKVGFRLKGGASRKYIKKTWKLSFNKFVDGRKWYQQKKIELKALQQDPSAIKEKLCLSILYSMNAPAQRASYAQLFINNQDMGTFLMEETIDDQFLKSRFGNEDGALFKCLGDLAYLGPDPQSYNTSYYIAQTPLAEQSYDLIRDLTFVINEVPDEEFVEQLQLIFDVDLYVRTLAFEVLTGNWDGLWNGNNYYLYYNLDCNCFQYIRHDMDMSFGMVNTLYPMATNEIYSWGDGGRGYRLINRVLATQPFRGQFTNYMYQLIDSYYHEQGDFIDRMNFLNEELRPLLLRDKWRSTDYAWSYDEFVNMPQRGILRQTEGFYKDKGIPFINSMGLKEFMAIRIPSALEQLDPPSLNH